MEHIMPLKPDTLQRIKQETIAALRQATQPHSNTTDKIKKMLSEAEQRRWRPVRTPWISRVVPLTSCGAWSAVA
jgi:hypothetical protein